VSTTRSTAAVRVADAGPADVETDVLVVGYGCAGAAAAIEAARSGARVDVLERASAPGGSSALSGGEIYLGGGTDVQRACGFEDTPEDMLAYLRAALGPDVDEDKLRRYCEGSVEHCTWLQECGIVFRPSLHDGPTWMPPTTDGLMWLGENAWPYNTLAAPAPRGHRPDTGSFAGWKVMAALVATADAAGVRTHVDSRANALLVDDDGRVVGVRARHAGRERVLLARRAVVLTTGGFVDDETMLAAHAPRLLGHGKVSDGGDDGSGIVLGTAVGGATRGMDRVQVALSALPAAAVRGMLVDARGERFVNEDVYPGLYSSAALRRGPGPWWTIIDETGFEDIPEADRWGVQPAHVAATVAELEAELGMPGGVLQETVATYNRDAAHGTDTVHHKDPRWLRPLVAPFAALDARAGFGGAGRGGAGRGTGVSGFTLGGLVTTADGEVCRSDGTLVAGLLAAGRASAGIHGEGYVSGTSLGDGTFFGRRAGRAAARTRPVGAPSGATVHT
jgi:3-oxo-5alpha-steroid 4-dehydrogenase